MPARPFSRHNRGDFTPAACVRTGRDTDLIDLGAEDIPGYGRVYLSTLEVADLAQMLGFVDGEAARQSILAARAETQIYKDELAKLRASEIAPIMRKLERLNRELRKSADDLLVVTFPDSVSGSDNPLLAVDAGEQPTERPAGGIPVSSDGDRGDAGEAGAGGGGEPGIGQPEPVRSDDVDDDGGAGEAAGADPEVDGPDLDESFGWLEQDGGAGAVDAAVDSDHAGD